MVLFERFSRVRPELLDVDILNVEELREMVFPNLLRIVNRTGRLRKWSNLIRILFSGLDGGLKTNYGDLIQN